MNCKRKKGSRKGDPLLIESEKLVQLIKDLIRIIAIRIYFSCSTFGFINASVGTQRIKTKKRDGNMTMNSFITFF